MTGVMGHLNHQQDSNGKNFLLNGIRYQGYELGREWITFSMRLYFNEISNDELKRCELDFNDKKDMTPN